MVKEAKGNYGNRISCVDHLLILGIDFVEGLVVLDPGSNNELVHLLLINLLQVDERVV